MDVDIDLDPEALVRAAERIAERLGAGGRLHVEGHGRGAADARHVVVEFMHPVTVGKRALSALEGVGTTRPGDVTMSLAYGGEHPTPGVDVTISDVTDHDSTDATTHSNTTDDTNAPIEVVLTAGDADASKVSAVLAYHVIWELVHVFLEAKHDANHDRPSASALYPMLYSHDDAPTGGVRSAAVRSAAAKLTDSSDVRERAALVNHDVLDNAAEIVSAADSVFTFGNGGSSIDADDAARLLGDRAHALVHDVATITALANDVSFDVVFARQLATLGRRGDCAIAFSTSGNSPNLIEAATSARRVGMATIGFAGYDGGAMASCGLFDVMVVVPSDSVHRIQEAQSMLMTDLARRAAA